MDASEATRNAQRRCSPEPVAQHRISTYFHTECSVCGSQLRVLVEFLGQAVACGHCGRRFVATDSAANAHLHRSELNMANEDLLRGCKNVTTKRDSIPSDRLSEVIKDHSTTVEASTACEDSETSSGELRQRVLRFLQSRGICGMEDVRVGVDGGVVVLRGRIASAHDRWLCVSCVCRVAGVLHVIDQLEVADSAAGRRHPK